MRTFALALRASARPGGEPVEAAFRRVLETWRDCKAAAPRADERGFQWTPRVEVRPYGRLTEFALDQRGDYEGRWRTLARLLDTDFGPAWLTVEMSLEDIAERFAPAPFQVQPPRFLRELGQALRLQTHDGLDLPPSMLDVHDAGEVAMLAGEIVSPARTTPLIVVTEPVYARPVVHDLGRKLAWHVYGLARVVHVARPMTYALTERLGKELSVFDGGVRTYWPGVTPATPPQKIPLLTRRRIEEMGPDAERAVLFTIGEKLILAAATRYREPPAIREFLHRLGTEEREAAATPRPGVQAELESALRRLDEARELEQIALSENQRLEREKRDLEADLEAARSEAATWRGRHDTLLKRLAQIGGAVPAAAPSDATDAVAHARAAFAGTLVIPDDVEVATDLGPHLFDALAAMNDAVLLERTGRMGDRRKAFAELFGKRLHHPARYEPGPTSLRYHGTELRERVHIKSGKPEDTESIYWFPRGDAAARKYLVVRIGRHAP